MPTTRKVTSENLIIDLIPRNFRRSSLIMRLRRVGRQVARSVGRAPRQILLADWDRVSLQSIHLTRQSHRRRQGIPQWVTKGRILAEVDAAFILQERPEPCQDSLHIYLGLLTSND